MNKKRQDFVIVVVVISETSSISEKGQQLRQALSDLRPATFSLYCHTAHCQPALQPP